MRNDVRNLLEQIGQPDFPYQEAEARQAPKHFGYWPLFEAVALHPALSRRDWIRSRQGRRQGPAERPSDSAGLFAEFEEARPAAAPAAPAAPRDEQDVRGLLRRLSEVKW